MGILVTDRTAMESPQLLLPGRQPTGYVNPSGLAQQIAGKQGCLIVPFSAKSRVTDIVSGRQPVSYSYDAPGVIRMAGDIRGWLPGVSDGKTITWRAPTNFGAGFAVILQVRNVATTGQLYMSCGEAGNRGMELRTGSGNRVRIQLMTYFGVANYFDSNEGDLLLTNYTQTIVFSTTSNTGSYCYYNGKLLYDVTGTGTYRRWNSTDVVYLYSLANNPCVVGFFAFLGGPITRQLAARLSINPYLLVESG